MAAPPPGLTMRIDARLREGVIAIADAAAAAILDVYRGDFDVVRKDDESPVTAADLADHHCIVDGLRALTPGIPVLSEESPPAVDARRRPWARSSPVAPLDGSRELIQRHGELTAHIAYVQDCASRRGEG